MSICLNGSVPQKPGSVFTPQIRDVNDFISLVSIYITPASNATIKTPYIEDSPINPSGDS